MRRLSVAVVTAALLCTTPGLAVAAAPTAKQVRTLKAKVRKLTRQRNAAIDRADRLQDVIDDRDATIDTLTGDKTALAASITGLNGQVGTLNGQVSKLTSDNAALVAGLPDAIAAVPLSDFMSKVLIPARSAWPCDSTYTDGSYWSIDFYAQGFC